MFEFLHSFLLHVPPETAHRLAALYLKLTQWWYFDFCRRKLPGAPVFSIHDSVSWRVRSRLGLAAGFDKDAQLFPGLFRYGFGFIEVGTVTPRAQKGNPLPRLWRTPGYSLVNHMGFNSGGVAVFRQNILRYKGKLNGVLLFANIGKNRETPNEQAIDDYAYGFRGLVDCVDAFVVNLSSPNTPGLVNLQTDRFLEELGQICPEKTPVLVKFSPDLELAELDHICDFLRNHPRFAGVVLTNTSRRLAESISGKRQGGLSGPPLFLRSLEFVSKARERLGPKKLIIGVGGVSSVQDALLMRKAGADLVEIYTAFVYQGPRLVRDISAALKS